MERGRKGARLRASQHRDADRQELQIRDPIFQGSTYRYSIYLGLTRLTI